MLALLIGVMAVANPADAAGRQNQNREQAAGEEEPARRENPERAITRMIRQMQMDLEGSSSRGFLGNINSAKFDDYPRFADMIERLTREDILRVYFRQVSNAIQGNSAQTILDAEMEMTRKNSPGRPQRRRQQVVIDFERTSRGWKIINLTPRGFFSPL